MRHLIPLTDIGSFCPETSRATVQGTKQIWAMMRLTRIIPHCLRMTAANYLLLRAFRPSQATVTAIILEHLYHNITPYLGCNTCFMVVGHHWTNPINLDPIWWGRTFTCGNSTCTNTNTNVRIYNRHNMVNLPIHWTRCCQFCCQIWFKLANHNYTIIRDSVNISNRRRTQQGHQGRMWSTATIAYIRSHNAWKRP